MTVSLKAEILEKLHLKKGSKNASSNIRKASYDFGKSDAPQFRGKSKGKRHQMAVAAGISAARGESAQVKVGEKVMYEGKQVLVKQINESSGMAVVKLPRLRDPRIVRLADLTAPQTLNEGFLGMAPILPTYRDMGPSQFIRTDLTMEDIGLDIVGLREDEFTGEKDDQEDVADNGSNVRFDGHTGKKEVDEIPTPSDTIVPAYSDERPPKQISEPLSTHVGAQPSELWKAPEWDGYDYPADAPEIPKPEFDSDDAGNPRPPHWLNDQEPGKNQENRHEDGPDHEETDKEETKESFQFFMEMDDMLGHEDREPHKGDTITVTLPAMASICCTVAHRMGADLQPGGHDEALLKAMIESLAEVGHGKTIDMPDLEAVASHMNGEESQEIENRDAGRPDHEGIAMGDHGDHGEPKHEPADHWPGDGDKTMHGKTKLMGGVAEGDEAESHYFGESDILAGTQLSEDEELRLMKRRAGLKFW